MVVFGLAFLGLLPWPERIVAPGLLGGAQRTRLERAARRRVRRLRRALHRPGARLDPRARRAAPDAVRGSILLAVYSLGLAVPFVLAGLAFARAMGAFRWLRDHYQLIRIVSGAL